MSDCPEIFKNTGDAFSGWNAAKAWLKENGWVAGATQRGSPSGIMPAHRFYAVAKWRNLNEAERADLSGRLVAVSGSPRNDDCRIIWGDATGRVLCPRCTRPDVEADADGRMGVHAMELKRKGRSRIECRCPASGKRPGDALGSNASGPG